jgi:hypothetical protein
MVQVLRKVSAGGLLVFASLYIFPDFVFNSKIDTNSTLILLRLSNTTFDLLKLQYKVIHILTLIVIKEVENYRKCFTTKVCFSILINWRFTKSQVVSGGLDNIHAYLYMEPPSRVYIFFI